jgi:hypothetical protein
MQLFSFFDRLACGQSRAVKLARGQSGPWRALKCVDLICGQVGVYLVMPENTRSSMLAVRKRSKLKLWPKEPAMV